LTLTTAQFSQSSFASIPGAEITSVVVLGVE
jgi:hypothetical protein